MIAPTTSQNMGGVTAMSLVLIENIASFVSLGGSVKLSYNQGATPFSVYFTPKSLNIVSERINDNAFSNKIQFKSPGDNNTVFSAIQPYINKKVLVLLTLTSGQQKVYGSLSCPMVLHFSPVQNGLPEDFNGNQFLIEGVDFLPGRFISS